MLVVDALAVQWDWDTGSYSGRRTSGDKHGHEGSGCWWWRRQDVHVARAPGKSPQWGLEASKGLRILVGWRGRAPLGGPPLRLLIHGVSLPGKPRRPSPPVVSPQCPLLRKHSVVLAVKERRRELCPFSQSRQGSGLWSREARGS